MSLENLPPGHSPRASSSLAGDARHNVADIVNLRLKTRVEPHRNSRLRNYFLGYREFMEAPPSPTPSASEDEFVETSSLKHIEQADKSSLSIARFRPPKRRALRNTEASAREVSLSPISPGNEMFLPNGAYGPSHQTTKRKRATARSPPQSHQFYNSTKRTPTIHSSRSQLGPKNGANRISKGRNSRTHQMRLRSKDGS